MNIHDIRLMFQEMGLQHHVEFQDILEPGVYGNIWDKTRAWIAQQKLVNGIDYLIEFIDEPDLQGQMRLLPVMGFKDSKMAVLFKLACV